jgi:hypothetical protein
VPDQHNIRLQWASEPVFDDLPHRSLQERFHARVPHLLSIDQPHCCSRRRATGAQGFSGCWHYKIGCRTDVILATPKGDVDIAITPQTRVLVRQPAAAGDIKPGAYLDTSNQNGAEAGTGTAKEIHLMDKGPNVNFAMNKSGLMMTNGHVKSITHTANGEEMDVDYGKAQTRHVIVGKDTVTTRMIDVGTACLRPGLEVRANTTRGTAGKPTATFIVVTTPGSEPSP